MISPSGRVPKKASRLDIQKTKRYNKNIITPLYLGFWEQTKNIGIERWWGGGPWAPRGPTTSPGHMVGHVEDVGCCLASSCVLWKLLDEKVFLDFLVILELHKIDFHVTPKTCLKQKLEVGTKLID